MPEKHKCETCGAESTTTVSEPGSDGVVEQRLDGQVKRYKTRGSAGLHHYCDVHKPASNVTRQVLEQRRATA